MKKHCLAILGFSLVVSGTAIAQTQNNIIGTTGQVGIDFPAGTTLTAPLTVNSPSTNYLVLGNPATTGYTSLTLGLSAQTSGSGALQVVKTNGSPVVYGNLNLNPYGGYTSVGALATSTLIAPLDVSGASAFGGSNGNICPTCYSLSQLSSTGKTLTGWNRSNGEGEFDFITNRGSAVGTTLGGFWFETWNGTTETPLMYILGNGTVGIGEPSSAVLTIPTAYKLAVDGGIVATTMVVKAYANWPDYVFTPKYKLRKLQEVKNYVLLNHHLPDVPSEQDIKENGLNLGDVENALTKKVEELTLYLIQKDEQLSKEKTIVDQQQKEIDALKTEMKAIELKLGGGK